MTILGPNGVPVTPTTDYLTPEQIVEIRLNHWREILPGEQLCGAATLANALADGFRGMQEDGATHDQILQVFAQMLHDVLQIHVDRHADDVGNVVVEATVSEDDPS